MELIDVYEEEKQCEYNGEIYSVRDNGAVMRHPKDENKPRSLDNIWTFGTINKQNGYLMLSSERVHRIVATAFLGEAPSKDYIVDHIDTNRQNNRPSNLRWITKLENILLNPITCKKIELLCGCSIEEVLNDISILRNKSLTPQFEWMKTVSKEEAQQSLESWKKWTESNSTVQNGERRKYVNYNKLNSEMIFPLEPVGGKLSLEEYCNKLNVGKEFCYKYYDGERNSYQIKDYYLNKETGVLAVATINDSSMKKYYLTSITLNNNCYSYDVDSYFQEESLNKYMTLAKGEEWTGGDVFDDFC